MAVSHLEVPLAGLVATEVELDRGVGVPGLVRLEVRGHRLDHLAGCQLVVHAVLHTMTLRGMRKASSYTGPMTTRSGDLELNEVRPDLWELRLPIPFEDGRINCFLLREGDAVDMIDCGMNEERSLGLIAEAIRAVAGASGHLRRLVVTHIHPDHYGGAGEIIGRNGAELFLHRLEVPMVHPRYLEIDQLVDEVGRFLEVH